MKKLTDNGARRVLLFAFIIIMALTAVSAVCGYFALSGNFDHKLFYYNESTVSCLTKWLPWVGFALAVITAIVLRVCTKATCEPKNGIPTLFTSIFAGVLMAVSAVFTFTDKELAADPKLAIRMSTVLTFPNFVALFGILAAAYFILTVFTKNKRLLASFSFFPALWAAAELLMTYFRSGEPINSDVRVLSLTTYAFLLLFFAEETRFYLDRQLTGIYYLCLYSALIFSGVCSIPRLAIILTGVRGFDFSFIDSALLFALFLLTLSRLADVKVTSEKED